MRQRCRVTGVQIVLESLPLLRHAILGLLVAASFAPPLLAADAAEPIALTGAERTAIGRAFAPTLVFHPLEEYLPTSPMFPFDSRDLPAFHDEGVPGVRSRLGSQSGRVEQYRSLSADEKLDHAALEYRVFSRVTEGRIELVVEYWCYYVFNAFTVRGAWFPYSVPDNHPHDLERIYLVLTPVPGTGLGTHRTADEVWARRAFRIARVITNAHDGSIPPNQYDARADETLAPPLTVLVERGSHAMAPDINRDGRFTAKADSTATTKLLWGIRDRGTTWGRYRTSFMDGRDESSVRLCGPSAEGAVEAEPCQPYKLYPAHELQEWFSTVDFSQPDMHQVMGRTPWKLRAFGDVRVEGLMVPKDPPDGRVLDTMLKRRASAPGRMMVGFTMSNGRTPTVMIGRRYLRSVATRYAPDIVAEGLVLFPAGQRRFAEATVSGSYTVDAITNVVVGVGWFSNGTPVADVLTGLDLRVGRLRVRPVWRFRERAFNARLTTTF